MAPRQHDETSATLPVRPGNAWRVVAFHVGLVTAYAVLAILHTYPLIRHLGTHVTGDGLGDNVSFIWNLWWMREALASATRDFWFAPPILAPFGSSLALHTHTALNAGIGATVLRSLTVVEAQNVLLLATLALNGAAMYWLARAVRVTRGPAAMAGAIFVVSPTIALRLMGHYNLVMAWPLLLACAALVHWWHAPSWRRSAWLAGAAALIPYADYYYAIYFGMFAIAYSATEIWTVRPSVTRRATRVAPWLFALSALAWIIATVIIVAPTGALTIGPWTMTARSPRNALTLAWLLLFAGAATRWRPTARIRLRRHVPRAGIGYLLGTLLLGLGLIAPLVVPAIAVWRSGDYTTQTSSLKSSPRGIDVGSIVMGPPSHGLIGGTIRDAYRRLDIDPMESSAWIGLSLPLLLIVAGRHQLGDRESRRWWWLGSVFGVWALGPYLTVFGLNSGMLLPQSLARLVPLVNNARIPGRAMVMVAAAVTMLVALALTRFALNHPRRRLAWCLAGLALVESLATPLALTALPAAGVYDTVRRDPRPGAVLTIPFGIRDGLMQRGMVEHDQLYAQTVHGHPLVGGFVARIPTRIWTWFDSTQPFAALLALSSGRSPTLPSCDAAVTGLRAAGVSYVVLYPADTTPATRAFVEQTFPLRKVAEDPLRILFEVRERGCEIGR